MIAKTASTAEINESNNQSFLPEVSVVIPIYNGETDLSDLIGCLYSQNYPRHLVEYLLVDNRSKDNTAKMIESAALEAKSKDLKIRYLAENQTQGPSAARNTGIRASTSEIIAFTDVDCRPHSNWLYELVQPFANPKIGVVGGAIFALPGKTILEEYAKCKKTLSHQGAHARKLPFGMTANLAIRRKAFEQVGLFRLILCEDVDICWRIQQKGSWQFYSATKAIIQHRHRNNLRALFRQWRGYGRGYQCLYELYGVDLIPRVKWEEYHRRLRSWLLKELPRKSVKMILGKASLLDLLETPILLLTWNARALGQKEVKLTEPMRQIEYL